MCFWEFWLSRPISSGILRERLYLHIAIHPNYASAIELYAPGLRVSTFKGLGASSSRRRTAPGLGSAAHPALGSCRPDGASWGRTLIWLDQSTPASGFLRPPRAHLLGVRGERSLGVDFLSSRLFSFQALPPPQGRPARPRRHVTTVDQSDIRVLVNALNDPTGAASFYETGVHSGLWAQGCAEDSPDPYTRRGLVGRPSSNIHRFITHEQYIA